MGKENDETATDMLLKPEELVDEAEFEIYVDEKRRQELIRELVELKRLREANKEIEMFNKEQK